MITVKRFYCRDLFSYPELDLSLANRGLVLVEGPNGAGKSSIFEGMTWTLFGKTTKKLSAVDVIRETADHRPIKGQTQGYVELDVNGQQVLVYRHREHKQHANRLLLYCQGTDITRGTDVETQKILCDLLGLENDTWNVVVSFPQGGTEFVGLSDAAQKAVLDRLFQLDRFGVACEKAKLALRTARDGKIGTSAQLQTLRVQLGEAEREVVNYESKRNECENNRQLTINGCQAQLNELRLSAPAEPTELFNWLQAYQAAGHQERHTNALLRQGKLQRDLQWAAEKRGEIERRIQSSSQSLSPDFQQMRKPHHYDDENTLRRQYDQRRVDIGKLEAEHTANQRQLAQLQLTLGKFDGTCPMCKSKLDAEQEQRVIGDARTTFREITDQQQDIQRRIRELQKEQKSYEQSFEEFAAYAAHLAEKQLRDQIAALRLDELAAETQCVKIETELEEANKCVNELQQLHQKYSECKAQYDYIQSQKATHQLQCKQFEEKILQCQQYVNPYVEMISQTKARIAQLTSQIVELEAREQSLQLDCDLNEFWVTGFGNQGVKQLFYENMLPAINSKANAYLSTIGNGALSVQFASQTKLQSGELRDKLDCQVQVAGGGGTYQKCSGGERRRIDLATLMAIGDISSSRVNAAINLRVLDEPFDDLDQEGCEQVIAVLQQLAEKHGTVLVTTHSDHLKSLIAQRIRVEKRGGCSYVS